MRYRVENVNKGHATIVLAANRKDAHEAGQALWPGEVVRVQTEQEYHDDVLWLARYNAAMSFTQDAYEMIGTDQDASIVACLNRAMNELEALRDHFAERLPENPDGTREDNSTVH